MPDSQTLERKRILFLVLNWGLGHATRSEVLIQALIDQDFEVHIGSDGDALSVLKKSFPNQTFYELPAYDIRYGSGAGNLLKLLLQAPAAMSVMKRERKFVRSLHERYQFHGVISDNRPGTNIPGIPSVYITHQLNIKAGLMSKQVSAAHARLYREFDEIWVPDDELHSLSGELSVPRSELSVRCIGSLSRLKRTEAQRRMPWAAILSGPEPARTEWENELRSIREALPQGGLIVRGKPEENSSEEGFVDYLNRDELSQLYADTDVVICRSGYSTLMDLDALGKKALLIPTPGQTEQEYLAVHQTNEGWRTAKQGECDYASELEILKKTSTPDTRGQSLPNDLFGLFEGE
ncbi:MAG: glycosyltransferase [Flavobacteriia bacterium]|nr:glycosyltransferase [Flavobacteriia bacterium]